MSHQRQGKYAKLKSNREGHMLPKELKTGRRSDASKVSTSYALDILKQAINKEAKGARGCKIKARINI